MARLARLAIPGQLHLLIQRVQRGESPFADPADRSGYLQCLADSAERHGVAIHGYGLLSTEVRLLVTPSSSEALGQMVQSIGRSFVATYNRRHGRRGVLWEGRFRSTVVEGSSHFLPCLHFTEAATQFDAAERAGEVPPWSSAPHHSGLRNDPFIAEHPGFWSLGNTPFEREAAYRATLQRAQDPTEVQGIALATLHGWALGSEDFVRGLGTQVTRRLRPRPPGRPKVGIRRVPEN